MKRNINMLCPNGTVIHWNPLIMSTFFHRKIGLISKLTF